MLKEAFDVDGVTQKRVYEGRGGLARPEHSLLCLITK